MLIRSTRVAFVCLAFSLTSLSGCESTGPSAGAASSATSPDQHGKLMAVLQGYQLPTQSVAPTANPDPDVQQVIVRMGEVARSQGLVFDGSRANQGIVVVGKQGTGGPILLALSVYKTQGRVATQDTSASNGLDFSEGMKMKDRFFSRL